MSLDLDLLRSFLTVLDCGSVSAAAGRQLRTQAAISLQMKRLEESVGGKLLERHGRRMLATEAGERLAGYARRLIDLADEAAMAAAPSPASGRVRLGIIQDIADSWLPAALGRFTRAHPLVRPEVTVERTSRLVDMVDAGGLDLAVAARFPRADAVPLGSLPMVWLAADQSLIERWKGDEIPLALFDAPCAFRTAATAALDRAGLRWRIAYQSPSLSGINAAVHAGLALTVRTSLTANGLAVATGLPALPVAEFALYRRSPAAAAIARLEKAVRDAATEHFGIQ